VTEEEVRGAIRGEGVTRVEDVNAVTMENDGTLTVAWFGGSTSMAMHRVIWPVTVASSERCSSTRWTLIATGSAN
jgi:uncharacterized membrane protein YcaP (DUF421 family)